MSWIMCWRIYSWWSHPYKKIGGYGLRLLRIYEELFNLWKTLEVNYVQVLFLLNFFVIILIDFNDYHFNPEEKKGKMVIKLFDNL